MLTIPRVARALQTVLTDTADAPARSTGFLRVSNGCDYWFPLTQSI